MRERKTGCVFAMKTVVIERLVGKEQETDEKRGLLDKGRHGLSIEKAREHLMGEVTILKMIRHPSAIQLCVPSLFSSVLNFIFVFS